MELFMGIQQMKVLMEKNKKYNFINFYKENGNNVVDAVESTLKTMAKIDDTISEQFDIVKICLN